MAEGEQRVTPLEIETLLPPASARHSPASPCRPLFERNDNASRAASPSHPREGTGNVEKRWVELRRKRAAL